MTTVSSTSSNTTSSTSTSTSSTDYLSFDTESLVEAKLASRYERIDTLETEVEENDTKLAAYQDMQDLLLTLQESLQTLRSDPSSTGQEDDVFLDRSAYLTTTGSTSASTYLSATVESGTDIGTHTITIDQIATSNKLGSDAQTSKTTDLDLTGTITVGTVGGDSAQIAITDTMSLADIADAINAENATTGVTASVMAVSESSYMLVLTTDDTGETISLADTSGTVLSTTLGFGTRDASTGKITVDDSNVLLEAQDAIFTVDNVTITRDSNDVDDVLEGVTLHLYAATSDGDSTTTDPTLTMSIENDLDSIKEAIETFITAYNAFREFVITNQTVDDDGSASDDATLFGDATLRNIATTIQTALSSSIDEESLALIGITFDDDNNLEYDEDTLDNALLDDLEGIQALFSYSVETSSGDIQLVRHPDASFDFTMDIDVDTNTVTVDGESGLFTFDGTTIKGVEGTAYEGLTFAYSGTTSKSISVTLTQGIADQIYNDVDVVANEDDGTLTDLISTLEDDTSDLEERISDLTESTETYADYLYTAYSTIAAKLASAQTTLDLLEALLNADSS